LKFLKILTILLLIQFKAYALIEVDITRGNLSPLPVAVSPLSSDKKSITEFEKILNVKDLGSEISIIVENNLRQSGLFNPLEKDAFLQKPDIAHFKPRFEDWKLIKAQALITGKVEIIDDNSLIVPDYLINLKNKSKKIIKKIESVSKLNNIENFNESNKNIDDREKNKFKKKKFYKKKFFKKKTK